MHARARLLLDRLLRWTLRRSLHGRGRELRCERRVLLQYLSGRRMSGGRGQSRLPAYRRRLHVRHEPRLLPRVRRANGSLRVPGGHVLRSGRRMQQRCAVLPRFMSRRHLSHALHRGQRSVQHRRRMLRQLVRQWYLCATRERCRRLRAPRPGLCRRGRLLLELLLRWFLRSHRDRMNAGTKRWKLRICKLLSAAWRRAAAPPVVRSAA
jgi:hypothetical protein